MRSIRPGSDLCIEWTLMHTDGTPFPLVNYGYRLIYSTGRGKTVEVDAEAVSVEDNVLTWTFSGENQTVLSTYSLILKVVFDGMTIATISKSDAFELSLGGHEGYAQPLQLKSYCDYITYQEAIQQMRHVIDSAAAAVTEAREILEELTDITRVDSAALNALIGSSTPLDDLFEVIPESKVIKILTGAIHRVLIDSDVYAVTQAGPLPSGYSFTLSSISFGSPMSGVTPPYIFVINTVNRTLRLIKYSI